MALIALNGQKTRTTGDLPKIGSKAPDFLLTKTDLTDVTLKNYAGKKIVLNIFPSLDTPVCASSVRRFNAEAAKLPNTAVLCISMDLPFAHGRFCSTEGLKDVIGLSDLRKHNFGSAYGVRIIDGPLTGLFSRAVVVVNEKGNVVYTQQVPDITEEPDYNKALEALSAELDNLI